MVYKSSRLAERVPAEAAEVSRVGRRRTREAVLLVGVPRSVVDGDLFAGFNEAFEVVACTAPIDLAWGPRILQYGAQFSTRSTQTLKLPS